ncbi:response regulator transcription factor [Bradyrhizobium liaoningense]
MTSKPVIAIVDDDDLARAGTGSLMRSLGYNIQTFPSAEAFLQSDVAGFDCLISDIQMPSISGLDLQMALKSRAPHLPVIFLTAFPNDRSMAIALNQGARQYLEKPCPPDDLCSCVATVIEAATRGNSGDS